MKEKTIVAIVPELPPKVNGLGDFAYLLAKVFKEDYSIQTVFCSSDPHPSSALTDNFIIENLKDRKSSSLLATLKHHFPEIIILNYVGYAYSSSGCPYWLLNGIKAYRSLNPPSKVITIFHEIYASGKPWQKAFWTEGFQKNIAFTLLKLSNFSITNTEVTYQIMQKKTGKDKITFIPVFSNVGEPEVMPPYDERENSLVIFGSANLRRKIFKEAYESLLFWINKFDINSIIEIGPPREDALNRVGTIPLYSKGILTRENVSKILLDNKFGMLYYPPNLLTKSGIFAAYASHGIVPIVLNREKYIRSENEMEAGRDFLIAGQDSIAPKDISNNLVSWYKEHSIRNTARMLYQIIEGNKQPIKE